MKLVSGKEKMLSSYGTRVQADDDQYPIKQEDMNNNNNNRESRIRMSNVALKLRRVTCLCGGG